MLSDNNLKRSFLETRRLKRLARALNELELGDESSLKDEALDKSHVALIEMVTGDMCTLVLGPELAESILDRPRNSLPGPTKITPMIVSAYPEIALLWGEFVRRASEGSDRVDMVFGTKLPTDADGLNKMRSFYGLEVAETTQNIYNVHWMLNIRPEDGSNYTGRERALFCDRHFFLDIICVDNVIRLMTICLSHER